jgi:hypothetical protein
LIGIERLRLFTGIPNYEKEVDTLVAFAKDGQTDNSRFSAAVELLSPSAISGSASFGRCDNETAQRHDRRRAAALEQRMIAAAPVVIEATAEVSDDAGELPDGEQDGDDCDMSAWMMRQGTRSALGGKRGPLQRIATVTRPGGLRAIGIA